MQKGSAPKWLSKRVSSDRKQWISNWDGIALPCRMLNAHQLLKTIAQSSFWQSYPIWISAMQIQSNGHTQGFYWNAKWVPTPQSWGQGHGGLDGLWWQPQFGFYAINRWSLNRTNVEQLWEHSRLLSTVLLKLNSVQFREQLANKEAIGLGHTFTSAIRHFALGLESGHNQHSLFNTVV